MNQPVIDQPVPSQPLPSQSGIDQAQSLKPFYPVDLLLLGLIWLGHVAANIWWLRMDTRPPYYDMAANALTSLGLYDLIISGDLVAMLKGIMQVGPYPPLTYILGAITALPFGPGIDAFTLSELLFLGILIFSVYAIAQQYAGRASGLLAAFIVSMYPIVYSLTRVFLLDLPLTAMVAFAVFCIFWSEGFRLRGPSLALGAALGLGMLTKWTFVVFVAGPGLVALVLAIRSFRARWLNVVLSGVVAIGIVIPWYLYNQSRLADFLQLAGFQAAALEGDPTVGTWASWRAYLDELLLQHLLLPFVLVFIVGLIFTLVYGKKNSYLVMMLLWIALPYVAFSNFVNKDIRYPMPYLPAFALFSGIGLCYIPWKMPRRALTTGVVLYAIFQLGGMTFGFSNLFPNFHREIAIVTPNFAARFYTEVIHVVSPPLAHDWQIEVILDDIVQDAAHESNESVPLSLGVLSNIPHFEPVAFNFVTHLKKLPVQPSPVVQGSGSNLEHLLQMQYVVSKSGDFGPFWTVEDGPELALQLADPTTELGSHFELVNEYELPDHTFASLYRQRDD